MSASILKTLGLAESVSGTYLGQGEWSKTVDAGVLEPINPTTGEVLGRYNRAVVFGHDALRLKIQFPHQGRQVRGGRLPGGSVQRDADGRAHGVPQVQMNKKTPVPEGTGA